MIPTISGWFPAIILPTAAALQLYQIIKYKKTEGVSSLAWLLFAIANIGIYIFAEKYFAIQSILAFLLTAILNILIVIMIQFYKKSN